MDKPSPVRSTRQRLAIRQSFRDADRPLSPVELQLIAGHKIRGLGIATVYRNIRNLLEEGWLIPVELPGEPPRYEIAGKHHHHHFRCNACGCVFELEGCASPQAASTVPPGFHVSGHSVVLYGVCRHCA
jgi:Fur family transcriptional regulator, ferric uptake regulator